MSTWRNLFKAKEVDKSYVWTSGNDPKVSHRKPIASGGFGEVHEVRHSVDHDNRERETRVDRPVREARDYLVKQRFHIALPWVAQVLVPQVRAPE